MRPGWVVSAIGHAGLVLMTLVAWPMASSLETRTAGEVVPVEVVTISDFSNIRALAPDPEDMGETEQPMDEPLAEAEEEPEPTPSPEPQRPPPRRNELDLGALGRDLQLDKERPRGERSSPRIENATRDPRTRQGAGLGTAETARLEDHLGAVVRAHIDRNRCRRSVEDMRNADRLVVTLEIEFDRNGRVRGQPRLISPTSVMGDPEMRVAVDYAMRAVRQCDPFPFPDDPLLAEHYDLWRQVTWTFHPRAR